jgi:hypothetical protein
MISDRNIWLEIGRTLHRPAGGRIRYDELHPHLLPERGEQLKRLPFSFGLAGTGEAPVADEAAHQRRRDERDRYIDFGSRLN